MFLPRTAQKGGMSGSVKNCLRAKHWELMVFHVNFITFSDILIKALNYSYETGKLLVLQRHGIVRLIPKKHAEFNLVENWQPLTLLNCDYKIVTKAIASQIITVLP